MKQNRSRKKSPKKPGLGYKSLKSFDKNKGVLFLIWVDLGHVLADLDGTDESYLHRRFAPVLREMNRQVPAFIQEQRRTSQRMAAAAALMPLESHLREVSAKRRRNRSSNLKGTDVEVIYGILQQISRPLSDAEKRDLLRPANLMARKRHRSFREEAAHRVADYLNIAEASCACEAATLLELAGQLQKRESKGILKSPQDYGRKLREILERRFPEVALKA